MKGLILEGYALTAGMIILLLAGCNAPQPITEWDPTLMRALPAAPRGPATAYRGIASSWMAPDARAQDLVYVSNVHDVTVYSYPTGKLKGVLKGFYVAYGDCADESGDVWITDFGHDRIVEYAHGGTKPVKILTGTGGSGCAVDPTTGNLAVTTLGPDLLIYKKASGQPIEYTDSDIVRYGFAGYDKKGNLFVDGLHYPVASGNFVLAELPKGSTKLVNLPLNQYISWPGTVQWNGKYLVVADFQTPVSYRFAIAGGKGTMVSETTLGGNASEVGQFWIRGSTLIAPNVYYIAGSGFFSDVLFCKYPAGGPPTKTITKGLHDPYGLAFSVASQ